MTTTYTINHDRISPETETMTVDEVRDYLADMNEQNDWGLDLSSITARRDGLYVDLDGQSTRIGRPVKTRTITLTDHPPVLIREDEWPEIASCKDDSFAEADPGRHGQALNQGELTEWTLRVRRHADGRALVYGVVTVPGWRSDLSDWRGGELLDSDADVAATIRRVGQDGEIPDHVIRECVADLPAQEL